MACNVSAVLDAISYPEHVPIQFGLGKFYDILQRIMAVYPNGDGCVMGRTASGGWGMTLDGAMALAGSPTGFLTIFVFTPYSLFQIFSRFSTWKLPIIQVVMGFPRPPHGVDVELFSITHVTGDPICTISSLFFTLIISQMRFGRLRTCKRLRRKQKQELVLLITAYEECGDYKSAAKLESGFATGNAVWGVNHEVAAHALAADRATKILPVCTSVLIFIAATFISFNKLYIEDWDKQSPKHIDIHNIAFSMTLLPYLPIVLLAATIGVPQSHLSVRRILADFGRSEAAAALQRNLEDTHPNILYKMKALYKKLSPERVARSRRGALQEDLQGIIDQLQSLVTSTKEEWRQLENPVEFGQLGGFDIWPCLEHGVIPSWRIDRFGGRDAPRQHDPEESERASQQAPDDNNGISQVRRVAAGRSWRRELSAMALAALGPLGALTLSSQVFPKCWNSCRIKAESAICVAYIISYVVGILLARCLRRHPKALLRTVLGKDIIITLVVIADIVVTVIGSLNQPVCWATCDAKFIGFPEESRAQFEAILLSTYLVIIVFTVAILLFAWTGATVYLWDGISVYTQMDTKEERLNLVRLRQLLGLLPPQSRSSSINQEPTGPSSSADLASSRGSQRSVGPPSPTDSASPGQEPSSAEGSGRIPLRNLPSWTDRYYAGGVGEREGLT